MNPNDAIVLTIVLITLILGLGTWLLVHATNRGLSIYANERLSRGYPVNAGGVTWVPAAAPAPVPPTPTTATTEKSAPNVKEDEKAGKADA